MKKAIPIPVAIGALVVILLLGGGFGWHTMTANGEVPNPNAGHKTPTPFKILKRSEADNMDVNTYINLLKQTRPELSDAERQTMADHWWQVKTGGAKPQP